MKIESIVNPTTVQPLGAKADAQISARERAIAALISGTPRQDTPVQNPSQVSPEELGAIKASSPTSEGQKDTVEAPAATKEEPKVAATAEETPLSSQYAVLARKEKQIRQREQALKAREDALKAPEAPKAAQAPAFDPAKYVDKDRLTKDPFAVLNELGLTYDELTQLALNGPRQEDMAFQSEIKALKSELAELKGSQEKTNKNFQDQQETQLKQAVAQIRVEAKAVVNNNPNFETIKETDSVEDVVDLIKRTFDEDGILMTVEEAAQQVEDYLVEEAMKIAKIKKIQQRLQPKAEASAEQKATSQQKQPITTLTNAVTSSRQLSARERALLAFEGKLGK